MALPRLPLAALPLALVAGCNAIFGITGGQASGSGGSGSGGGGDGGIVCLPARPDSCAAANLSDPDNCCAPGRSCRGGTCTAGECGPVTIISTPSDEMVEIVVAGDDLIWSSGTTKKLYATSISAGDGVLREIGTAMNTSFQNISAIATDGVHVYFADYATPDIGRMPIAGGAPEIVVKGDLSWIPGSPSGHPKVLVAGGYVYWAAAAAGIFRAPITGALPAAAQQIAATTNAYAVALDATYVYWDDDANQMLARLPIAKIGTDAVPELLVADQDEVGGLVVDGDSIFWSTADGVFLTATAGPNRAVTVLASQTDSSPNELFTDGRDLFWTTTAYDKGQIGGRVRRVPRAGGAVVTLAENSSMYGMGGITADCDTLFWLDGSTLSVVRATK